MTFDDLQVLASLWGIPRSVNCNSAATAPIGLVASAPPDVTADMIVKSYRYEDVYGGGWTEDEACAAFLDAMVRQLLVENDVMWRQTPRFRCERDVMRDANRFHVSARLAVLKRNAAAAA